MESEIIMRIILIMFGVAFGSIFIVVGIKQFKKYITLKKTCTQKTIGYVSEIVKRKHTKHNSNERPRIVYRHAPVVKYLDTYLIEGIGKSISKYKKGDKAKVYYNPKNPSEAFIGGEYNTNIIIGVLFIISGLLAMISIISIV